MPSFIILDVDSGYIWGDTRDVGGKSVSFDSIVDACRAINESVGNFDFNYNEVPQLSSKCGFKVYRVDINGSEAVPVIHDGQDDETIASVDRNCDFVGYVEYSRKPDIATGF